MRYAAIGLVAMLGGCASVTLNGQDLARAGAASIILVVAASVLAGDETESADQHQRCPGCPPSTIED